MPTIIVTTHAELDAALKAHAQLHTCPTPRMARDHYRAATRYLEVSVPLADLRPIDDTKAKSPTVTVVREVTIDGDEVTA